MVRLSAGIHRSVVGNIRGCTPCGVLPAGSRARPEVWKSALWDGGRRIVTQINVAERMDLIWQRNMWPMWEHIPMEAV